MTRTTSSPSQACPSSGLQQPISLRWRRCRDLPCGMLSTCSVIVEEKLYIGGGNDDGRTIYEYQPQEDKWLKLEVYQFKCFAMATLNKKLTLVGGRDTSNRPWQVTNQIAVWETKGGSHQWVHPYSNMPTRRYSPAVATHNQWLVVAGGRAGFSDLATVEVLNAHSRQWLSVSPLPFTCCAMTSAIVQDKLFLIGGSLTKQTLAVSLSVITTKKSAQWQTLPPPQLEWSAAIAFHGSLLAIGGCHGNDLSTAIHIYQPDTKQWTKVGDLPTPRSSCSCTLLPSGEILVAGGYDSNGKRTSRVDTATLNQDILYTDMGTSFD